MSEIPQGSQRPETDPAASDIPGSAHLEPDPLQQAKSSIDETLAAARDAAAEAAADLREGARDVGAAADAGLDRAQAAIERAVASVSEPDVDMAANDDDKLWAILAHLSIFVLPIIGPLLVLMLKQPMRPFVKDQAQEALNYQITMTLATTVGYGIFVVLTLGIGLCLAPLLILVAVPPILAAAKNAGLQRYRHPFTMRLVK